MSASWVTPAVTSVDRFRGHTFAPPADVLAAIPNLYGTEDVPTNEKVVVLHYFVGGADWYIVELDPENGLAFGWAEVLSGCGEWGYVSLPELGELLIESMLCVERDLHWSPRPVSEVDRIPVRL